MSLEKAYNAKKYEDTIYETWERSGFFTPSLKKNKKTFSIMMPPPNATGTLHLGHAVMLALEDIMIRFHRMKGEATLWLPGTDHASIATQNRVEKFLAEEGLTRHQLGRSAFLKRIHEFVKNSQHIIRKQIRKMGSSCDWSRERYTLEDSLSRAVREIFVRMYHDGLIYRGHRIVHWCPRCSSTLADDEVEYKQEKTRFYYFRYGPFVIGTARPETKFADKIVVVHPDDKRYTKYIGKEFMVPWIEGKVKAKVLADESVDPQFGTGAMTITPAHDFNDFEMALRHGLEILPIIDEKGNLLSPAGSFTGKNARASRGAIVEKLRKLGLVEKIDENYLHNISLCYRCLTPVEPLVSEQWFIAVDKPFGKKKKTLKQMALEVVRNGKIKIVPERFEKIYFHWMENLHDWCISRQIWFGHQIPVWYCKTGHRCKEPVVQTERPQKCPNCQGPVEQDADTLDTWFSSGLWTFSTLGWPEETRDIKYFHPTTVLETGYDILFFWIARMILMTLYALNEIPFQYVYLHGLVRTREGKKMSKSDAKTCIDPLDMIEKYGADSLRLSMVIGSTPGNDIRLYEEKIAGFRNFVNKIWNAARFALLQLASAKKKINKKQSMRAKTLADKWILTTTQTLIAEVTADLEHFRFSEAGTKIYDFTWGWYCAWYLEISKGEQKNLPVLKYVLETVLTLLHPFVPYITEVLWKKLGNENLLMSQPWPAMNKKWLFQKEASQMSVIIEIISAIRNLRHESRINPALRIHAVLVSKKWKTVLEGKREPLMRLGRLKKLDIATQAPKLHPTLTHITAAGVEIMLPLKELIDIPAEILRLSQEKQKLEHYVASLEKKLLNPQFVERAPQEIVTTERNKLSESRERIKKIMTQLKNLQND